MTHSRLLGKAFADSRISEKDAETLATSLMTPMSAYVMEIKQDHFFRVTRFHDGLPPITRSDVGPPPKKLATLGRLNRPNQPIVYGATKSSLALVEAAREVGWYAIAEFKLRPGVRKIKALTLGFPPIQEVLQATMQEAIALKNYFGEVEYSSLHARKHSLQWLITQPQSEGEKWAYQVTSRVADEFREKAHHDAIVYGTSRPFSHIDPVAGNIAMTPAIWDERFALDKVYAYRSLNENFLGPFDPTNLFEAEQTSDNGIKWSKQHLNLFEQPLLSAHLTQ